MNNKHTIEERNLNGYFQRLECIQTGKRKVYRWVFFVTGFNEDLTKAYVLKSDGTDQPLPMDATSRILIAGKRYASRHWLLHTA